MSLACPLSLSLSLYLSLSATSTFSVTRPRTGLLKDVWEKAYVDDNWLIHNLHDY